MTKQTKNISASVRSSTQNNIPPASRRLFLSALGAAMATPLLAHAASNCEAGVNADGTAETKTAAKGLHYTNPLKIEASDPYVLHAPDGRYYLYCTGSTAKTAFPTYVSTNLVDWTLVGETYLRTSSDAWCVKDFWAPEVFYVKGRYYMCYSAEWGGNPNKEIENFRIGIAVADSPTGPFRDLNNRPLFDPGYPVIDADLLFDADGRIYLYFSRCTTNHPVESDLADWARRKGVYPEIVESWIYGVEVKPDFSGVMGEPTVLLRPPVSFDQWQDAWEDRTVLSRERNGRWTEGPCSFKQGAKYYLMYSANYYAGPDYALGYATAEHPLGPYTKAQNNPVAEKDTQLGGDVMATAHNCVTFSPDGKQMYCLYGARTLQSMVKSQERVLFLCPMEIHPDGVLVVGTPDTKIVHPYPSGRQAG